MNDIIAEPFITDQPEGQPKDPMAYERVGGAKYYWDLEQGCHEWLQLRLGIITASEMNKVLTPTLKPSNNAETRKHLYQLLADRITRHVEDHFVSFDMERGKLEEVDARVAYEQHYDPVSTCGIVINDSLGFNVGFSPDGLVGDEGMIETKSRVSKYQMQTILDHMADPDPATPIPLEFMLQVQGGLFVTRRKWCDFISYSNGLNMIVIRCYPDEAYQEAIKKAAIATEEKVMSMAADYVRVTTQKGARVHPVERNDYSQEIQA